MNGTFLCNWIFISRKITNLLSVHNNTFKIENDKFYKIYIFELFCVQRLRRATPTLGSVQQRYKTFCNYSSPKKMKTHFFIKFQNFQKTRKNFMRKNQISSSQEMPKNEKIRFLANHKPDRGESIRIRKSVKRALE